MIAAHQKTMIKCAFIELSNTLFLHVSKISSAVSES